MRILITEAVFARQETKTLLLLETTRQERERSLCQLRLAQRRLELAKFKKKQKLARQWADKLI